MQEPSGLTIHRRNDKALRGIRSSECFFVRRCVCPTFQTSWNATTTWLHQTHKNGYVCNPARCNTGMLPLCRRVSSANTVYIVWPAQIRLSKGSDTDEHVRHRRFDSNNVIAWHSPRASSSLSPQIRRYESQAFYCLRTRQQPDHNWQESIKRCGALRGIGMLSKS